MAVADAIAFAGHQLHVCRSREAGQLLRWPGELRGLRMLDVAGGDGYWADMPHDLAIRTAGRRTLPSGNVTRTWALRAALTGTGAACARPAQPHALPRSREERISRGTQGAR